MHVVHPTNKPPLNYILISGSYKQNLHNDDICKSLGFHLSKLDVGIISGANKPGLVVSSSLCKRLDENNKYDPDKIVFYLRRKEKPSKALAERVLHGTVKFYGRHPIELRQKMISEVSAVIIIGGSAGTIEEEHLAVINNVPVIPIACSGGSANLIWKRYKSSSGDIVNNLRHFDGASFEALNNDDVHLVVDAVISTLRKILKT
jgi:hypothetical protein